MKPILNSFAWNKHRKAAVLALWALYLASAASGTAQETGAGRHMLWRVTSGDKVAYILGSVHMLPESAYPLDPVIEHAFEESQDIAFELNLDSATNMSGAMSLLKLGTYQGDRTLEKSISKETYKRLKERLKKTGLPPAMFNKMEPWMVAMMLTAFDMQGSGYQNDLGIDMYFHKKAKEAGKKVMGLETLEFQVGLFDKLPEKAQEEFLKQTLDMASSDDAGGTLDTMVAAWKKGDVAELERVAGGQMGDNSDFNQGLLYERNRNWIPQIEEFLKSDTRHMVIVGALHLVGQEGVIELLRRKGYGVEQL